MGGRGASLGVSNKGKPYGTEYKTVLQVGRIKFVKQNKEGSSKAPIETRSKGRIYVTLNSAGVPNYVTFYVKGKRVRQIDLNHSHEGMKPHTHRGYEHSEKGTRPINDYEKKIIDRVLRAWQNRK